MHIDYTAAPFIRDWPARCPCGADAAHRYGLCRKCQARATWRRRKAPTRHRLTAARRIGRLLPPLLLLAHATSTDPASPDGGHQS